VPRIAVVLTAALLSVLASSPLQGQKKKEKEDTKPKTKQFHATLFAEYPGDTSWKDLGKPGLGVRFPGDGAAVILYRNYYETPGGGPSRYVFKFGNVQVQPTNTSKVIKGLQDQLAESCKKASRPGKIKKFKCKAGKGAYGDIVVSGGKEDFGIKELEVFTRLVAGVDSSRSYNPREIEMHYRPVLIKCKEGVHYLTIMASKDVLKKHNREIQALFKTFAEEEKKKK
jgi:hypothetical protein